MFQDVLAGLPIAVSIPIWDQYVDLMTWSLDSLATIFGNGGLAIIAFTIIIKTIILPLTVKSIRSSKAMQELGPRIKEIQKKHGKDRQRVSQETMALYNAHGVNPMSGCLPMLIQIPIFFGLYLAIQSLSRSDEGAWTQGFLWLSSLHESDPFKVLPVMAGLFQFIQSRMMRPAGQKVTDPQQQIMNQMMNFMPLMVIVFGWTFASGPVLYWATQSVYSVVQQWFITGWGNLKEWFPWLPEMPEHRRLGYRPPRPIEDVVVVSGQPPVEQKGFQGWLAKRMAEAQQRTEENAAARREQAAKGGRQPRVSRDEDVVIESGGSEDTPTSKPARTSTSYQDRVNAATKFGATPGKPAQAATAAPASANGRMSSNGASGNGRTTSRPATGTSTSRKSKRKRTAS
ncbi:MAG TPA: YidC/Oxa1 family membrane protein insertase [Thermomicrobiales bacterium]|nr:YidC/Oxa1 family membrane protein insertase [Thermomicrobiales bacterium]